LAPRSYITHYKIAQSFTFYRIYAMILLWGHKWGSYLSVMSLESIGGYIIKCSDAWTVQARPTVAFLTAEHSYPSYTAS